MNSKLKYNIKIIVNFLQSTMSLIIPIIRILISKGSKSINVIDFIRNNNKCIVLGNGPSLKVDIEKIMNYKDTYDYCCVNNFVLSKQFNILKPTMYIFLDNYFWDKDAHYDWAEQREKTFNLLNEIVDWKMQIFIPMYANKEFVVAKINNPYIDIIKLKVGSIPDIDGKYSHILFNSGYFGPGSMNVLIYAIYLSIKANYKEINIYGADLSFHKDVEVNQKTNDLVIKMKHFYGEDKFEILTKNPAKTENFTMREFMSITTKTFFAHDVLSSYAKSLNISIVNKSNSSLIDAYDRCK